MLTNKDKKIPKLQFFLDSINGLCVKHNEHKFIT